MPSAKKAEIPGIHIKVLEESVGHMIVVELYNSTIIRGRLLSVETSMNLILEDVIMKDTSGTKKLPQLIIRGNLILYTILPSKIKYSPLLTKVKELVQNRKEHFSGKK